MNTKTRTGINATKKFGDKNDKNLMDTAKRQGTNFAKNSWQINSSKNCRSYQRFNWK